MPLLNLGRICCPARFFSHSLLISFLHLSGNCQNTLGVLLKLEIRNKKLKKDRVVLASDYIDTFLTNSAAVCFETQCNTLLIMTIINKLNARQ